MRSGVPTRRDRAIAVVALLVIVPLASVTSYLFVDRFSEGGWSAAAFGAAFALVILGAAAMGRRETRRRDRCVGGSQERKLLDLAIKGDGVLPPTALADRWRPEVDHQLRMLAPGPRIAGVIYFTVCLALAQNVGEGRTGAAQLAVAALIGVVLGAVMGPLLNLAMKDRRENLQLLLNQIDVRLDRNAAERSTA